VSAFEIEEDRMDDVSFEVPSPLFGSNTFSTTYLSVEVGSVAQEDTKEDDTILVMYNDAFSCRKVPKVKASKAISKQIKHIPTLVSQKRQYAFSLPENL